MTTEKTEAAKRTGRPSSPETQARLDKLVALVNSNGDAGTPNPAVAEHLGLPTLQTSVLAKRLTRDGLIRTKKEGRSLIFYPAA